MSARTLWPRQIRSSSTEVPSSAFQRRGYLGRFQAGVNDGTGVPRSTVSQRKFAEDNAFAFMSSHSYSVVTARGVFLSIACSPCFARRRDVFQALIGD